MPVEYKYFVREDFDEHAQWILDTCIHILGVLLSHIEFDQTSAPLGEGENTIVACVETTEPVLYVTSDKVRSLEEALSERFGDLNLKVRSTCPRCKKRLHDHYGYSKEDEYPSLNVCNKCSSKELEEKESAKKVKCPTCSKKFVVKDHGESYTMNAHLVIRSGVLPLKLEDISSARVDAGSYFDHVRFCSKKCLQLRLDRFIKDLSIICNNL